MHSIKEPHEEQILSYISGFRSIRQSAEIKGISPQYMQNLIVRGKGPKHYVIGGFRLCHLNDLEKWEKPKEIRKHHD